MKIMKMFLAIILFLVSCKSEVVIDTNYILSSDEMKKEIGIFDAMKNDVTENSDEEAITVFLTESSKEFEQIKKFFSAIKTDNDDLKKAVEAQLKICEIFSEINQILLEKKSVVNALRKLYYSDMYYREFVDSMKAAKEKESALELENEK
ncbi:MAG: hypothetical protein A2015_11285 [Spirochaetes bacterium GWF1_31_7]|nr:MAG: hypothetical protein A2Y30_02520 [Spirochaetes bacterium GWE1_32_154]OHD46832.1 MAG: hypothetical protein A2Y29_09865 [Spirochaetes bacterium GWE2_31_10]OHD47781.1 MAG: hypothetical protein A2015_11285 [Spirochaetes bacterium GWF1_31_7]OHD77203.1 MAG: hypothetical protein A2355_18060 [Spirochaetes bacterium RIFOXYB1_FULL_32_8]HBD95636.1 hypothetical protein [Spirochaetia bacterium]